MPITLSGIDSGQTQFGIGSYIAIADRSGAGSANDRTDVDDFHKVRYLFQTAEIASNAPGIEVPIIGNSPSAFPTQQGPLDIINGFTFPAFTSNLEPVYRNLLNDSRALDTSSTTLPSDTNVGGRLAALGTATIVASKALTAGTPDSTGWAVDPIARRLSIVQSTAAAGILSIKGLDANGSDTIENVRFNGTATTVKSNQWFTRITSLSANIGTTVTISESADAEDRPFVSEFRGRSDARLLYGNDIYVRKGTVPNTYRETFIDSITFTLSRDGAVAFTIGCVGKRPEEAVFINGSNTEPTGTGGSAESFYRTSSGDAVFPFVERRAFVGWQGGLFYRAPGATADSRLPLIEGTVTISNNLAFTPTISGHRRPGAAYRTRRAVTLSGTMEYKAEDASLISDVLGGEYLTNTFLRLQNAPGFPAMAQFNFGRLQFTNVPSAPVTEEGVIARPIDMISVDNADGTRPDVTIRTQVATPLELAAITLS